MWSTYNPTDLLSFFEIWIITDCLLCKETKATDRTSSGISIPFKALTNKSTTTPLCVLYTIIFYSNWNELHGPGLIHNYLACINRIKCKIGKIIEAEKETCASNFHEIKAITSNWSKMRRLWLITWGNGIWGKWKAWNCKQTVRNCQLAKHITSSTEIEGACC